ncbi:MAG: DUF4129 domain-containing protein [Pseudomonadota bacterium]
MTRAASTAQTVAEAHARLRANPDIQFDLPHAELPKPPTWSMNMPGLDWLFWPLVAIGAAAILFLIARTIVFRMRDASPRIKAEREAETWRPEERAARALLAEADAMAEAGRYDEAARLLLHRSLEDIAARRPRLLRPALTSREIARVAALPEAVRGAFAAMAAPVERSLFGGRSLSRDAWEEARAAYRRFALPGAWA